MAEFDVRLNKHTAIDKIRVCDRSTCEYVGDLLVKGDYDVMLTDSDQDKELTIQNQEHAENLILGLQKAIDLGWFN